MLSLLKNENHGRELAKELKTSLTRIQSILTELRNIHDKLSIQIREFDKEDLLIKEIIKNYIILNNAEEYYEKLGFYRI